jgi:hypothetical protein
MMPTAGKFVREIDDQHGLSRCAEQFHAFIHRRQEPWRPPTTLWVRIEGHHHRSSRPAFLPRFADDGHGPGAFVESRWS